MDQTTNTDQFFGNTGYSNEPEKNNRGLLILVGLLALALIGLGISYYFTYSNLKKVNQELVEDKNGLINDLNELKIEYNNIQEENGALKSEVDSAKTKIDQLIEELKKTKKADAILIRKYRRQVYALRHRLKKLLKEVDSLKTANAVLTVKNDSLGQELTKANEFNQKVVEENKALSETVQKAKYLAATNIKADGVRIKNNGKVVETNRARRADQIRVCTTLPANPVLESGPQTLYVQIVNPKGDVIGSKDVISVDGQDKIISGSKQFQYEGQNVDICIYVVPENKKEEIVKGEYMVTFFHNGESVGTANFKLK